MLQSIRIDFTRLLLETPPKRRPLALLKRSAKVILAASFFYLGLTGPLLRKILQRRRAALLLGFHGLRRDIGDLLAAGHALPNIEGLLEYLARHLAPAPLEQIAISIARAENPPAGTFAITFDDGLSNNVQLGIPLLQRLGLPVTFFVPSGPIGSGHGLWDITLLETVRAWPSRTIDSEPGLWPVLTLTDPKSRYAAFCRMQRSLKAHQSRRDEILRRLAGEVPERDPLSKEWQVVGPEMLRQMIQTDFRVGAHSRSHLILSGLDAARAREEIEGSREDLEALLGQPVLDFAYPNGRFADFNETSRRLVAEAGYRCAVTTEPGLVRESDDPFALRRCMPEDVPAFLAAFDLLILAWKDRNRHGDGSCPLAQRASSLSEVDSEALA